MLSGQERDSRSEELSPLGRIWRRLRRARGVVSSSSHVVAGGISEYHCDWESGGRPRSFIQGQSRGSEMEKRPPHWGRVYSHIVQSECDAVSGEREMDGRGSVAV